MVFDYATSGYAVREDIPDAHRTVWRMIGEPGCWWRVEDRVAFVAKARNARFCEACRRRREALSQYLSLDRIRTTNDNAGRALSRCQIELLAARVSSLSDCFY